MGFGVNDLQIRGLMRFIEMMSKQLNIEDDVQVVGTQIVNVS